MSLAVLSSDSMFAKDIGCATIKYDNVFFL